MLSLAAVLSLPVSRAPGTLGRTQATAAPARSKRRPAAYARALDRVSAAWTMYSTRARTGCHSAARGLPERPRLPCPVPAYAPRPPRTLAPQRTAWRHLTKASTNHTRSDMAGPLQGAEAALKSMSVEQLKTLLVVATPC